MSRTRGALGDAGLTMIEVLIGIFIVTVVFLAFWFNYSHNQEIWRRGKDKVLLQQALSQANEAIARDVRAGGAIQFVSATDISIFSKPDSTGTVGPLIRRYFLNTSTNQLAYGSGGAVVPEKCTALAFIMAPDTTEIEWKITLTDNRSWGVGPAGQRTWGNQASIRGSAHLRNLPSE